MIRYCLTLSILVVSNYCFADSLDISAILNRSDSLTESSVASTVKGGSGFESQGSSYAPPRLKSLEFSPFVKCPDCESIVDEITRGGTDTFEKSSINPVQNNDDKESNHSKSDSKFGQSQQPFSGMATGMNGPGSVRVINGIPYVDRDSDNKKDKETSDLEMSRSNSLSRLPSQGRQPSAVELNKSMDSSSKKTASVPRRSSAGIGTPNNGGFGDYQSQTKKPQGVISSAIQALKGFSKGFFGADGGQSGNGASLKLKGLKNTKKISKKTKNGNLKGVKSLLNDELRRQKRRFASHLEFGDSKVSIFRQMCQHYSNWALKNNIPNGKNKCPEK